MLPKSFRPKHEICMILQYTTKLQRTSPLMVILTDSIFDLIPSLQNLAGSFQTHAHSSVVAGKAKGHATVRSCNEAITHGPWKVIRYVVGHCHQECGAA